MAKFKFRLEPLLKLRKLRQQESEREMAEKVSEVLAHEEQIEKLLSLIDRHYDEIRKQSDEGMIDPSVLISDRKYLNHLHVLHADQKNNLLNSKQEFEQTRKKLAEAKKGTDVMKKLRENELTKFRKEQEKLEIRELDDLTSVKSAWMRQKGRNTI